MNIKAESLDEAPERPMPPEYEFLEDGAVCRLSTEGPKKFTVSMPAEFDDNLREGALAGELLRVVAERDDARQRASSLRITVDTRDAEVEELKRKWSAALDGQTIAARGRDEARARERELLALTGKQHERRAEVLDGMRGVLYLLHVRQQEGNADTTSIQKGLADLIEEETAKLECAPDAQKAAGELEELRAELKRAEYLRRQIDINAENSAKACSSLRARVRELEAGGLALAEDASRMQARLSRLDGLLASKEPPEGLARALRCDLYSTSLFAIDAWRWVREQLAAPSADQEAGQHHASVVADLTLRHLLWLRHGCPSHALYGDDGEMSCGQCVIDFLRWSPEQIAVRFETIGRQKHQAAPSAEPRQKDVLPASTTCPACGHIVFVPTPAEPQEER